MRTTTSYAQAFIMEVGRVADEAFARMMRGEHNLYLYFKPHGMQLKIAGEDEVPGGYELARAERLPTDRERRQLYALIHEIAVKLPILPTDRE